MASIARTLRVVDAPRPFSLGKVPIWWVGRGSAKAALTFSCPSTMFLLFLLDTKPVYSPLFSLSCCCKFVR